MTRNQILWLCIAISFILHMWGLDRDWSMGKRAGGEEIVIPADFAIAADVPPANGLALEQAVDTGDERKAESAARRLRREARRRYFQRVREAIEDRKFRPGSDLAGLIGNVLYTFRIRPDDTFSDIRLKRSSGDPVLDRAALDAIRAAGGKVKRPAILRDLRFTMSVTVKYQYSL
ncbi:MAG: TonB family protein [Desulfovibrionaceae bacterium]|nr:TonB family protein [Desulfovibrionaceae bacterium]